MLPLLHAEFRKVFTIRSTYILSVVALLLAGFISFWVLGYHGNPLSSTIAADAIQSSSMVIGLFVSIVAILLVTHEYRYNTIMYTLTSSNSRTKVLFAKLLVVTGYALGFTMFISAMVALLAWLGVTMRYDIVVSQRFHLWDTMWRTLFFVWGYVLMGMIFALLFRHVVGTIVTFAVLPNTIEGLLSLLLKEDAKYLPFSALNQVQADASLSPGKGALVFSAYLVVGWVIAWLLFLRRDAN